MTGYTPYTNVMERMIQTYDAKKKRLYPCITLSGLLSSTFLASLASNAVKIYVVTYLPFSIFLFFTPFVFLFYSLIKINAYREIVDFAEQQMEYLQEAEAINAHAHPTIVPPGDE